ncbi:MAG: phosphoribosylanthranilate isomerase [Dehalococcoidia bacterium]|nr:phosphoribosylanthranilate isomerase [Dehalococcoidia bacterium]
MIGIVFAQSKRRVTPQEAYDILEAVRGVRRTPPPATFEAPERGDVRGLSWFGAWSEALEQAVFRWRPLIVGLFADQSVAEVNDIADAAGVDLVQLSGDEDADFVRQVERPVLKAVHIGEQTAAEDVFDRVNGLPAAGLLLDTKSAAARGGTGRTFDWEVATEVARRVPFLLAGGLSPETVAGAIAQVAPWGVDVSTGVETDGKKDIEKIRAFIRAAKGVTIDR